MKFAGLGTLVLEGQCHDGPGKGARTLSVIISNNFCNRWGTRGSLMLWPYGAELYRFTRQHDWMHKSGILAWQPS